MSRTWEHYQAAARHHEHAAYQFKEAAKYHQTEEHEKAAHLAYLAHGHAHLANVHATAAARWHIRKCDILAMPPYDQSDEKKTAA
jgi:hypothetical protein